MSHDTNIQNEGGCLGCERLEKQLSVLQSNLTRAQQDLARTQGLLALEKSVVANKEREIQMLRDALVLAKSLMPDENALIECECDVCKGHRYLQKVLSNPTDFSPRKEGSE